MLGMGRQRSPNVRHAINLLGFFDIAKNRTDLWIVGILIDQLDGTHGWVLLPAEFSASTCCSLAGSNSRLGNSGGCSRPGWRVASAKDASVFSRRSVNSR